MVSHTAKKEVKLRKRQVAILDEEEFEDDELEDELEDDELPDPSPDALERAEKNKAAQEAGYTVAQIADFLDWVPNLTDAIQSGVFDGPPLKAIVTAALLRRDAVLGKRVVSGSDSTPATPPPPYTGPVLGEGSEFGLYPVNYTARTFVHNSKRYAKGQLTGKVVRTSLTGKPWYYNGLLIKVISVGTSYLTAEFVEDPRLKYPSSDILKQKSMGIGSHIRVPFSLIEHVLYV